MNELSACDWIVESCDKRSCDSGVGQQNLAPSFPPFEFMRMEKSDVIFRDRISLRFEAQNTLYTRYSTHTSLQHIHDYIHNIVHSKLDAPSTL